MSYGPCNLKAEYQPSSVSLESLKDTVIPSVKPPLSSGLMELMPVVAASILLPMTCKPQQAPTCMDQARWCFHVGGGLGSGIQRQR